MSPKRLVSEFHRDFSGGFSSSKRFPFPAFFQWWPYDFQGPRSTPATTLLCHIWLSQKSSFAPANVLKILHQVYATRLGTRGHLFWPLERNRTEPPKTNKKKRLDVSGRFLKIQLMWSMIIFNDRIILSSDSLWFAQKSSTRTQHSRMMFHLLLRIRERQNWLEHQTKSRNLEPGTYKITSKTWMNVSSENAIKIWNRKNPQVEGWFKRCHGSCNQQFFEKSSAKMGIFPWWNLLSIKNGCLIGILMLTFL